MPYFQLEVLDSQERLFVSRSMVLDPSARIGGYPAYSVELISDRGSVRTILYTENDRIYLTDDKVFMLTNIGRWVFSSNPDVAPVTLSSLGDSQYKAYEWRDEWANMKTDAPTRTGLLWPMSTATDALRYVVDNSFKFALYASPYETTDEGKKWSEGLVVTEQGRIFPFDNPRFVWGKDPALFRMLPQGKGIILASATTIGKYVHGWIAADSVRWILASGISESLVIEIAHISENTYQFSHQGKKLTFAGTWMNRLFDYTYDGVEFYTLLTENTPEFPKIDVNIVIIDDTLSNLDRYILSEGFVELNMKIGIQYSPYNSISITENMPKGGSLCTQNEWDGTLLSCYERRIPYSNLVGPEQCTTLDDFSNDVHCTEWAIENRGDVIDAMLFDLCKNEYPGSGRDTLCKCYYPDKVYYDDLVSDKRKDIPPSLAPRVAESIRATNLLQCVSGLCMQDGSVSSRLYYREGRKCDVCVQAQNIVIEAPSLQGQVYADQVCAQVDITYTWQDIIGRLIALDAYRTGYGGVYRNVIINQVGNTVVITLNTEKARAIINQFSLLRTLPKDASGSLILTQNKWATNPVRYSNELLVFFLRTRE